MKRYDTIALLAILLLCCDQQLFAAVRPYDFGLREATTGVQRYWALYNAHVEALDTKDYVDYTEIKELEIEIPKDAKSIPLGRTTDFKGAVLTVKNNSKDFTLFTLSNSVNTITLPQNIIDGHSFSKIEELFGAMKLLIIEDKTPWINERKGYNHAVYRKDVLLLKKGIPQNSAVMPYGEGTISKPVCSYSDVDNKQKKIVNLYFRRTEDSTYKTCMVEVSYQNNVLLKNITTYTPPNDILFGDQIIFISNCTNVTFRDIHIEGVYCPKDSWGYGVGMDNVYNVKCYNVSGTGTVFGSNNVNTSYLKKCNISRYDIHCYGRDAQMDDCIFWGSGFRTSSFYGNLIYNRCTLRYYLPVSIRNEYTCNVPYNLVMKSCTYYMSDKYNYVIYTGNTDYQTARRPELEEKCLPNVKIESLRIIPDEDVKVTYLFLVGYGEKGYLLRNLTNIYVKNVVVEGNKDFLISTSPFDVKNEVDVVFQKKGEVGIKMRNKKIGVLER